MVAQRVSRSQFDRKASLSCYSYSIGNLCVISKFLCFTGEIIVDSINIYQEENTAKHLTLGNTDFTLIQIDTFLEPLTVNRSESIFSPNVNIVNDTVCSKLPAHSLIGYFTIGLLDIEVYGIITVTSSCCKNEIKSRVSQFKNKRLLGKQ